MAAIITTDTLGISTSSLTQLGDAGLDGNSKIARSREQVFVNAATGNLVVRGQDEYLSSVGVDQSLIRTYNSLGGFDVNADGRRDWRLNLYKRLLLPSAAEQASPVHKQTTISREDGDGAVTLYAYDSTESAYLSHDGTGAVDRISFIGGDWQWQDGDTGVVETYQVDGDQARIILRQDRDGHETVYSYEQINGRWLVKTISDSRGQITQLNYTENALSSNTSLLLESIETRPLAYIFKAGDNWESIATLLYGDAAASLPLQSHYAGMSLSEGVTLDTLPLVLDGFDLLFESRVRYGYDNLDRLAQAIVDLTPEDHRFTLQDNNDGNPETQLYVPVNGETYVTSYSYEGSSSRLASITQGDGSYIGFTYDGQGRVVEVNEGGELTEFHYGLEASYTNVSAPAPSAANTREIQNFKLNNHYKVSAEDLQGDDVWGNIAARLYGNGDLAEALANHYPGVQPGITTVLTDLPTQLQSAAVFGAADLPAQAENSSLFINSRFNSWSNKSYLEIDDPMLGNNAFTIQSWVKLESVSGGQHGIFNSVTEEGKVNDFSLRVDSLGRILFGIQRADGVVEHLLSNVVVQTGRWHQITVTWNGSLAHIYLDGVELNNLSTYQYGFQGTGQYIGTVAATSPNYTINGSIDELRLYNRALDSQELFQQSSLGLKAHWNFNDSEGIAGGFADLSGNANTARLINYDPSYVMQQADGAHTLVGDSKPEVSYPLMGGVVQYTDMQTSEQTVNPYYTVTDAVLNPEFTQGDPWGTIAEVLYLGDVPDVELIDSIRSQLGAQLRDALEHPYLQAGTVLSDLSPALYTYNLYSESELPVPQALNAFYSRSGRFARLGGRLSPGEGPMSMETWFNPTSLPDKYRLSGNIIASSISAYGGAAGDFALTVGGDKDASGNPIGRMQLFLWVTELDEVGAPITVLKTFHSELGSIMPEQWQHVVVSWDGALPTLFINGDSIAFPQVANTYTYFLADQTLGAFNNGNRVFQGYIDEFTLYDRPWMESAKNILTRFDFNGKAQDTGLQALSVNHIGDWSDAWVADGAHTLVGAPKGGPTAEYPLYATVENGLLQTQRSYTQTIVSNPYYIVQDADDNDWATIAERLYGTAQVAGQLQADHPGLVLEKGVRLENLQEAYDIALGQPVYVVSESDMATDDPWAAISIRVYGSDDLELIKGLRAALDYPVLRAGLNLVLPVDLNYADDSYTTMAQHTEVKSANGDITSYVYDDRGRLRQLIAPVQEDSSRFISEFDYDPNSGELTRISNSDGRVIERQYNEKALLQLEADNLGNTLERFYTPDNLLQREIIYRVPQTGGEPAANPVVTRYVYDPSKSHQLRYTVSAQGRVTYFEYDRDGQLVQTIVFADGLYDVGILDKNTDLTFQHYTTGITITMPSTTAMIHCNGK